MASFRPEIETCPLCGSKGNCRIHAYYGRKIVDFINGQSLCQEICIMRLICDCGHTHAILPDFIVPYSSYGLFFILRALAEHFSGFLSVERLCERFGITRNQFYKWLMLWAEHKVLWLGALDSLEISDRAFLKQLILLADYSDFSSSFVCSFSFSFLHAHRDTALSCQRVF